MARGTRYSSSPERQLPVPARGSMVQLSRPVGRTGAGRGRRRPIAIPAWCMHVAPVASALIDAVLMVLAFLIAYWLRYGLALGGIVAEPDQEPFRTFFVPGLLFASLTVLIFMIRGVYNRPRWVGLLDRAASVVGGITTATAALVLSAYFLRFNPSRLTLLYALVLSLVAMVAKLVVVDRIRHALWERGIGVERVLVVGAGTTGRRVMQGLLAANQSGLQLVGYVDQERPDEPLAIATERRVIRPQWLGQPADLARIGGDHGIDDVIIALPAAAVSRVEALVDQCRRAGFGFRVVPDLYQLSLDRVELGEVAGVPLIGLRDARISGWHRVAKRGIDIVVASVVLLLGGPAMVVVGFLIRRDSVGPVLCRQQRVGRDGVPIRIAKFRTMVDGAECQWTRLANARDGIDPRLFKMQDDPRLTPIGKHLRRWSLDELPQFWDVLRGRMSLVGPRPPLPEEVSRYEDWHRQRLLVRPGLTGLWQVNGRSNLTFDEMVRLDLYYAEHWSPWLDAKIVLRTIPAVLSGRGAC